VKLKNKGYSFALQYHDTFFSGTVSSKTQLNLMFYCWSI